MKIDPRKHQELVEQVELCWGIISGVIPVSNLAEQECKLLRVDFDHVRSPEDERAARQAVDREVVNMDTGITVNEAARIMNINPSLVRRWAKSGKLKAKKFGRDWRIDKIAADNYRRTRKVDK